MNNKTRKTIFFACLLLFIIIAPLTILYSQGYRLDFENKAIRQTGGLFLRATPRRADIYINDKPVKRTDFFFGSALIENLLPKEHKIEIKKPGHHVWLKNLTIREKEVTEARNIILFPENIVFNAISEPVENFWLLPDEQTIILLEKEDYPSTADWALKAYDLERKIKSHLIREVDIDGQGAVFLKIDFSPDSKKIYLKAEINEKISYFTLNINQAELTETEAKDIKETAVFRQAGSYLYYLDHAGHLFKAGLKKNSLFLPDWWPLDREILNEPEKLSRSKFSLSEDRSYVLEIIDDFVFLQEDNHLYQFNFEAKEFERFFEGVRSIEISPDNETMAYLSSYEIWLLFLSDQSEPLPRQKGDRLLLARLSENISQLSWLNSHYLLFLAGENIKISETDDRDKINLIDIFKIKEFPENGNSIKIIFNRSDKKMYLLHQDVLYVSDPLFI